MDVLFAFGLTLFAGLSTGIGSAMALLTKQTNKKFLSFSLGLSAGVMLYVSFIEILPKGVASLVPTYGERMGNLIAILSFFGGIFFIALIDKLIPTMGNPHEVHTVEEMDGSNIEHKQNLMRMGLFTAIAIAIHNFPEGLATFISAIDNPETGIAIAFAIAIHNIPEGIAVAVPVFYATGNRKKAFAFSFLSGVSEPIGAIVGYFLLIQLMGDVLFGVVFSAVAGIMVFICLDELLPSAREYGEHHISIYGLILGMFIMAMSLLLFM